jgi:membrane-associated phospholipid phosphatase
LARYWMVVNVTMAAAGVCVAMPQQEEGRITAADSSPAGVAAPVANAVTTTTPRHSNWLTTVRDDAASAPGRLLDDQKQIWLSPLKLRLADAEWLAPLAGITTAALLTDASFSKALPNTPSTLNAFKDVRLGGVAALGAASGGFYLWSLHTHDPHQRETGLLAGESVLDSLIVAEGLKLMVSRERPLEGNGQGRFFEGGTSFPSDHSAAAWAAAGIVAHEYHGTLTKLLAYGLASGVSIASVGSKQHFPSDVLIGSGLGWLVSESVYRTHHNPELAGASWDPLKSIFEDSESGPSKYPGSPYVPVDSWVYRAFDRLAALGYISSAYQGTRPWSRERCARMLVDVDAALAKSPGSNSPMNTQIRTLLEALHHEFAREEATFTGPNRSAEVDSIYTRTLSANGTVLTDGYHFGQTFAYDYGRPFREGTNLVDGGSVSATYGTLFFYLDGEYQHSPSAPALSADVRNFIVERDKGPIPSDAPFPTINQFALLDAYAGVNLQGWQLTFGNQSLSWGPGVGGSLLLSNNAAPFPMLRLTPENPIEIPGLSKVLGPFILDQFVGQLEGHYAPSQPWIYGQKISLKPFRSFEFAYSRTTLIGGTFGNPITSKYVLESIFGRVDSGLNSVPGDSRTAVDWTWRVPGVHDWVTFYGEMEDDDDLIPLQNPSKSVLRPGLYFSRLPFLPKWDLHFEYASSTSPGRASFQSHGDLNYWNLDYPDGYTNNGDLMANTVGREGVSLQAWIRYWASPTHTLDFSWKQNVVLNDYVPGGGKWQDYQASYSVTKRSGIYLKGFLQFEHIFSYPLLFPGSKNNVVAAVELGFLPQWRHHAGMSGPDQTAQASPSPRSSTP